jgi:xylose isomerase
MESFSFTAEEVVEPKPKKEKTHPYDYDLFVIGGGSGGISAARWA